MEHQIIDWKSKWDDEFLKWICGFANAQGGRLEIGKDDKGKVVGLSNPQKLLDDLPNKIKSTMGVIPDVNLYYEDNMPYIVIETMPYPNPISYRGKYYVRSGSTTQELTGVALDEFVLRKYGRTWDSAPIPHVSVDDLDIVSFRYFRKKSIARGRLSKGDLDITDGQLLENLKLIADGGYLKRAAILTFHEDPEKWVTGAYVKIGYFKSADDLVFQDEVHGALITMPDKVVDILFDKYFKGIISYEGLQRVEDYPVNGDSLREAVLNAIVHKDYATGTPIQIRVYDDKITIFNTGALPPNWTVDDLLAFHTSIPHNPDIANAFFKSGLTEAWGRGIEKIISSNVEAGKPAPQFDVIGRGLRVTFYSEAKNGKNIGINIGIKINKTQRAILDSMVQNPTITAEELANIIGIAPRSIESNISKLKKVGCIERDGSRKTGCWIVKRTE